MSKKILNLQLIYKGKTLDNAIQGRDFTSKFYIGKNKNLLWQLLDISFPDKFKFVEKKGSNYNINLSNNMDVKVHKDGEILDKNKLQNKKLISNNRLILKEDSEGEIVLADNWKVSYFFKEPYKVIPTKEQLAIYKEYARKPELTDEDKFTRIFIILGLLVTTIGLVINNMTYEPPKVKTFTEKYQVIQENLATQVQIDETEEVKVSTKENLAETDFTASKTKEEVVKAVEQAQEQTQADLASAGFDVGGFDGDETGLESDGAEIYAITTDFDIVASGPGDGVTGGYTSSNDLDLGGAGFDLDTSSGGLESLGDVNGFDIGSAGFEEVDIASIAGDVGDIVVKQITSTAEIEEIRRRHAGIKIAREGEINVEEQTPEERTQLANIDQIVSTYKPQLRKLFRIENLVTNMYGTIEITIVIKSNGKIDEVLISQASGSKFTDSFIEKAKEIVYKWNIKVKETTAYSFRMQFYKN
jgi:hypothetical protein